MAENTENTEKTKKNSIKDFVDSLVVAFVIAMVILTFIIGNYMIPSESMLDTIQKGDRILVSKVHYMVGSPQFGDVAVFEYPVEPDKAFIKRVIGTPGDTIEIRNKKVIRNGIMLDEPYVRHSFSYTGSLADNIDEFTVPEGMFFMMGDNRGNSEDSRFWGFVPESSFKGKAFIIYFSKEPRGKVRWSRLFTLIK